MVRYEDNRPILFRKFPITVPLHGRKFRPHAIRLLFCIIVHAIAYAWMLFCTMISNWRFTYHNSVILPDILFTILPQYNIAPMPDVILYFLFTVALVRAIWHTQGFAITRRYLIILSAAYVIRGFVMLVTSFPDPQSRCWNNGTFEIGESLVLNCGDLIISARAIFGTGSVLVLQDYSRQVIPRLIAWCLLLASMIARVVARQNYTVDIFLGIVLPFLLWRHYHTLIQLAPSARPRLLNWIEALDDEEDTHDEYESCSQKQPVYRHVAEIIQEYVPTSDAENEFAGLDITV